MGKKNKTKGPKKEKKKISDEAAGKQLDALLIKQRMDFHFGKPEEFVKPITYCIIDKGMFQVRKNRIGTFTAKIEEFESFPKGDLEEGMEFTLPKIPLELLNRTVGFFKEVNKKHSTEAHVQFIYNTEKKEYDIFVPEQDVSAASVKYENDETDKILKDPNKILVLDIHSHNTMSAFFSSTDDQDEKRDQLYGVIGHLERELPEMNFRFGCGGEHVNIAMEDIFQTTTPSYEFPEEWIKKLKEKTWSKYGHFGDDDSKITSFYGFNGYGGRGYHQPRLPYGQTKKEAKDNVDSIIDRYTERTGRGIHGMTEKEFEHSEGMVMPDDDVMWDREEYEAKKDFLDPDFDLDTCLDEYEVEDIMDSLVNRKKEDWMKILVTLMHEDPTLVNQVVNKCNHRRKKNDTDIQRPGKS